MVAGIWQKLRDSNLMVSETGLQSEHGAEPICTVLIMQQRPQ